MTLAVGCVGRSNLYHGASCRHFGSHLTSGFHFISNGMHINRDVSIGR